MIRSTLTMIGPLKRQKYVKQWLLNWQKIKLMLLSTWQVCYEFKILKIRNLSFSKFCNEIGGWAGGSANSPDFIKNADLMWKQSVWSSTISSALAAKHLKAGGCLVLPGAQPALNGTAGMMGYGMAKAAVHQLTKSMSDPKSGLPENASALCVSKM